MPGPSTISSKGSVSHSAAEVTLIDEVRAAAATLSGVAEALQYRAAAESDDMLAMLADVICAQVDSLRHTVDRR